MRHLAWMLTACLASIGCHSDPSTPDAAPADAAIFDAAIADARPADARPADAEVPDADEPDADEPDAGPPPCDQEVACPAPDFDRVMLCGRLVDLGTSTAVEGTSATQLRVKFYDALAFANNPLNPPEFEVTPDSCGRFVSRDATHAGVHVPGTNFVAIATADEAGASNVVVTGAALATVAGAQQTGVRAFVTRRATETAWSTGAGVPSLAAVGIIVGVFINTNLPDVGIFDGTPVAGVKMTADGQVVPANDFYFDDSALLVRSTVGKGAATGVNGSAIVRQGQLQNYGGQSTGCTWPQLLGATVPGAIFVQVYTSACN